MIASLPMYDRAETAPALDRLWHEIRGRLSCAAPAALTRGGDLWQHWQDPALILSQTCGYPYRTRLHAEVQLIGAPDCDLPGCPPGHYNSVFVTRSDDTRTQPAQFADAILAYNEALSQSGWAAPQTHAAAHGFAFSRTLATGGHRASTLAVAEGRADIAAVDAVTWRLIQRHDPHAARLREIGRTAPTTPALPFITGRGQDAPRIRKALADAIAALAPAERDALSLYGVVQIAKAEYRAVPNPPPPRDAARH
ncbi:hypothetical protein DC366_06055 [Pelagivirga sediminicola]|uniref:Phosphate ABC transporter substrate-binding protein n=1 Tax=Pelagivirga sediminicola TaxID=2170575 RepID=A0A2T7GA50_9RHOB|nr:PhnD/SsuA/transferrin family substrate-binding protein [Pelagivirga sediminicola]PVA11300.1 hypothetical protein DC366_06055 [Pelagivirga sediminicola]